MNYYHITAMVRAIKLKKIKPVKPSNNEKNNFNSNVDGKLPVDQSTKLHKGR